MIYPNVDPLVIKVKIMGVSVHRILVDSGAFCNIFFKNTLDELDDFANYVEPCEHVVKGFGDAIVKPYNIINLTVEPVSTLDENIRSTKLYDFLVIDQSISFNRFLSRPFKHELEAASSTYYFSVKFPTKGGVVGTMKGEQVEARGCSIYSQSYFNTVFTFSNNKILVIDSMIQVKQSSPIETAATKKEIRPTLTRG